MTCLRQAPDSSSDAAPRSEGRHRNTRYAGFVAMKRQTFRTLGIVRAVDDNDSPDVEQTIDAEEIAECVVEGVEAVDEREIDPHALSFEPRQRPIRCLAQEMRPRGETLPLSRAVGEPTESRLSRPVGDGGVRCRPSRRQRRRRGVGSEDRGDFVS
jgi:hypothetical protein